LIAIEAGDVHELTRRSVAPGVSTRTDVPSTGPTKTQVMENSTNATKNTTAFYAQSAIAFGLALFTMLIAVYYLPVDPWPRAFLALGTVFLTTSTFSLAKCVRDAQENQYVVSRLDQARVDRILAEHDPWKDVA
jgi:hypothetical protein